MNNAQNLQNAAIHAKKLTKTFAGFTKINEVKKIYRMFKKFTECFSFILRVALKFCILRLLGFQLHCIVTNIIFCGKCYC